MKLSREVGSLIHIAQHNIEAQTQGLVHVTSLFHASLKRSPSIERKDPGYEVGRDSCQITSARHIANHALIELERVGGPMTDPSNLGLAKLTDDLEHRDAKTLGGEVGVAES
jgi:hypothetical protein